MRKLFARAFIVWWKEELEEKYEEDFQGPISQELLRRFLSNSVFKVRYMMALQYVTGFDNTRLPRTIINI